MVQKAVELFSWTAPRPFWNICNSYYLGYRGRGKEFSSCSFSAESFYSRLLPSWWFWRTPNGFHYSEWNNICSTNIVTPWEAPHSSSSSLYNITLQHNLLYILFRRHSLIDTLEKERGKRREVAANKRKRRRRLKKRLCSVVDGGKQTMSHTCRVAQEENDLS